MSKGGRGPRAALLATLGLAAAGIAATAVLGSEDDGDGPAVRSGGRTVAVTRQTLVERETVQGTLGYAGTRTVPNRLAGSSADDSGSDDTPSKNSGSRPDDSPSAGSGTVTALRRPGSVVRRGGVLYRLDGEPVVLMYGSIPTYRDLETGVAEGRDVRQLEENLTSLGFDPGAVDDSFTSTTASAVADWQESAGLPETGSVELGRVVFLPGPRRIGEHRTTAGSVLAAGSEVLDTSSTRRVVTIELDAALQSIARKGDGVEVILPDQSTVRGRITAIGRVAREKEDSGADPGTDTGAEQELVIDVTVRLRSARGLGRFDEAPVSVGLAQESRRNVLAVPVNALVARRGGGYGVELAAGRRIVPVRTGLFAGGYVEVAGSGIRAGVRVVVPDA